MVVVGVGLVELETQVFLVAGVLDKQTRPRVVVSVLGLLLVGTGLLLALSVEMCSFLLLLVRLGAPACVGGVVDLL